MLSLVMAIQSILHIVPEIEPYGYACRIFRAKVSENGYCRILKNFKE